jgi:hypothetical protein
MNFCIYTNGVWDNEKSETYLQALFEYLFSLNECLNMAMVLTFKLLGWIQNLRH